MPFINSKGNYTCPSIHHPNYNLVAVCPEKAKIKIKLTYGNAVGLVRLPMGHGGAVGKVKKKKKRKLH